MRRIAGRMNDGDPRRLRELADRLTDRCGQIIRRVERPALTQYRQKQSRAKSGREKAKAQERLAAERRRADEAEATLAEVHRKEQVTQ